MWEVELNSDVQPLYFLQEVISILKEYKQLRYDGLITEYGLKTVLHSIITKGEEYIKNKRE